MNFLFSVATILFFSIGAQAVCKAPYSGEPNLLIRDYVKFDGYGKVCADTVCVSPDRQFLRTVIPAGFEKVCVSWHRDQNDSTNPSVVCDRYEQIQKPAQNLQTPVERTVQVCLQYQIDPNDSTRPTICQKWETRKESLPLYYRIERYAQGDYRRENQIEVTRQPYPICQ